GVIYAQPARGDELRLDLIAAYAPMPGNTLPKSLRIGEGLIGQCAYEKNRIVLANVPHGYLQVGSVLGATAPSTIIMLPVLFEDEVKAVIELASLGTFSETHLSFLDQLTESIGIVFNTIESSMRTEDLLQQSQTLTRELQSQQEELKTTNDRLEQQAVNLQNSEGLLKKQQEELQLTNEQLQEKARQLSDQMRQVEYKNREIEQAKAALEEKAEQLALSSRYKSEFLANMSHELRTPLNSLLILARMLADNPDNNLTLKQIDYAQTIHGSGTDLLSIINDILDLAKIESGTVTLNIEPERFSELHDYVERTFRQVANGKGLAFDVKVAPGIPAAMQTDEKRLQQILKNLLSNAFKFTDQGKVSLQMAPARSGWTPGHPQLDVAETVVAFSVTDTGIGIPANKQQSIFEPFQQADGTTSREYGGTGLGLSISRELARLLGGEIQLRSTPAIGSTFTLFLPLRSSGPAIARSEPLVPSFAGATSGGAMRQAERLVEAIPDDRHQIQPEDPVLLIVEDDPHYARLMVDLAHDKGFKVLAAARGSDALELAQQFRPKAVSLDVFLPDMLGWTVLTQLKQNPETRHIPIQILTMDEDRQHGLAVGAFSFLTKPTTSEGLESAIARIKAFAEPRRKRLLVVEDNVAEQRSIAELLGHDDIDIAAVGAGREALELLRREPADCVVLDLRLPDMSGFEVLEAVRDDPALCDIPVVVFTGKELSPDEDVRLRALARSVVVKGVESPERLLDETALFLHRVVADLPPHKQQMLERLLRSDDYLAQRSVLVVDDDVCNTFALSSVLERRGMKVVTANTGREAIDLLHTTPDLAIVLMDIMMPEMDGYQTMRAIRQDPLFGRLPIVALTAKAMKGDREKCLEAGASDYLAKPVNTEQLLSTLRMWLRR
ncbi:MAG TPA: response regulator, partial [Candidatus Polarisedimenticolaceae bacterium]|nr:response regulator [Candidatus Polarisedimenticolaceae bacterium]